MSGTAPALLLAAALLATAGAQFDFVTVEPCVGRNYSFHTFRVRHYPKDSGAISLWMSHCGLTEVNTTDLENLEKVETIYLDSNSIAHLDTTALRTAPAMLQLSLALNKFREPPAFATGSCSKLTTLYLRANLLTSLEDAGTFSACTKLKWLGLESNLIEYLHPDILKSLTELEYLGLNSNKIKFIPDNMFISNRKLMTLWLDKNRLTYLPPGFVSSFKRAGAGLDSFSFDNNPWHCACLLELMADVRRAGVSNYDYWYNFDGTRRECVYSGAEPRCARAPAGAGLLRTAGEGDPR